MVLYLNSTETHKIRQDLQKEYARSITPLRVVDIDAVVYLLRKYFLRSRESFIHTLIKRMAELCFTDGKFFPQCLSACQPVCEWVFRCDHKPLPVQRQNDYRCQLPSPDGSKRGQKAAHAD
jgi:hypothetical protein